MYRLKSARARAVCVPFLVGESHCFRLTPLTPFFFVSLQNFRSFEVEGRPSTPHLSYLHSRHLATLPKARKTKDNSRGSNRDRRTMDLCPVYWF